MASRLFAPRVLLVLATLAIAGAASAEPNAADKETARALMATGRQDRTKGDLEGALKAFTAADAIMRVPTTGLEVARSQVALGLLVEARDTALQVARLPVMPREPAPFRAARESAAALGEELLTRIPSLTITVKNAPEGTTPTVTVDGAELPAGTLGAPRTLDPGHHVVAAKAGAEEAKQEVDLAEQETKSVALELPAQDAVATTAPAGDATHEEPQSGRSTASKVLLVGGFGAAGVGLIVGSITGALSLSKTSSVKSSGMCAGSVCNPSEDGDLSSARTMATVSNVSFIIAGVGAVAGVVGLLTGHSTAAPSEEHAAGIRVVPTFGPGSIGLRGTF
jgi:hypothetical protein